MNHTCTAPIEYYDLRLLLIIRRVTVSNEKPPKHAFFELKHENNIKTGKNYASATLHSSDLSLGFHCICSQSRDTIPLSSVQKILLDLRRSSKQHVVFIKSHQRNIISFHAWLLVTGLWSTPFLFISVYDDDMSPS